jgi:phosphatidylinositol alpha 1,6-mannosyltransferase
LTPPLRVALFTDCFREANGVATLSRQFAAFAGRRQLPFLCVHSGPRTQAACERSVTTVEVKRGPLAFPLDRELTCDPFLSRHKHWVTAQVLPFRPQIVQIVGPGDIGILGLWVAHTLRVPLVASWHTNLHAYAGRRLHKLFSFLPDIWRERISDVAERQSLRACTRFYGLAHFLLAPNDAMVNLLQERTGKPAFLMAHGVDTEAYSPQRRRRRDSTFSIGYVGRLTPEKHVRLFAGLEKSLLAKGARNFRLTLIGEGGERDWLRKNLRFAEMPGVLHGQALAEAFANMDVFVFPSHTDTFGLVLLEAMASGVPVVASPEACARAGLSNGAAGIYAPDLSSFTGSVLQLMNNEALRQRMGAAARLFSCSKAWNLVFEQLYLTYQMGMEATNCKPGDWAIAESRTAS